MKQEQQLMHLVYQILRTSGKVLENEIEMLRHCAQEVGPGKISQAISIAMTKIEETQHRLNDAIALLK